MDIIISKNNNLKKLNYWLKYNISTSFLLIIGWLTPIAIFLIVMAAVIFTPFMLKVFFEEKRYGWIVACLIIFLLPLIITFILFRDSEYFKVLRLIPFAFYYFYCFLLKLTLDDWMD